MELGITARPVRGLILSADVAYLDATYDRYPDAPCTSRQLFLVPTNCVQDLSGRKRAFAPEFSGSIGASYVTNLTGNLEARFSSNLSFTSEYFQQPLADVMLEQEGFAKLDARIAIGPETDRWELAVVGRNLTDEQTGSFRQPLPTSPGSYQVLADPSTSIGIQATIRY